MKKQSGFTLIELLLVLAIIGIISAIAIPALLSQRARARDKSAIANCENNVGDCVGQWDKLREAGTSMTAAASGVRNYLISAHTGEKNPWNAQQAAFTTTATINATHATMSAFISAVKSGATTQGLAALYIQTPSGSTPGFIGIGTMVGTAVNGSTKFVKASAIE